MKGAIVFSAWKHLAGVRPIETGQDFTECLCLDFMPGRLLVVLMAEQDAVIEDVAPALRPGNNVVDFRPALAAVLGHQAV